MLRRLMSYLVVTAIFFVVLSVYPDFAFAGPGGIITKGPKLIFLLLAIVLSPFILYVLFKENLAVHRAKKALRDLAKMNDSFRFPVIKERVHAIVTQVYTAWGKADIEKAQEWMTDWYWQNQKLTVLEEWENQGLRNVCKLKKINYAKPLYVDYYEDQPGDGEGTRISLLVEVKAQDYLVDEKSGKVVEGKKKFLENETIWTIILEGGKWKLSLIEEGSISLEYAAMQNNIEEAVNHITEGYKFKRGV